jgi:putative flippase GtrA
MCFSFAANSIIVFPGSEGRLAWRLLAFFATNATSMYVVQTTVLWLGLHLFPYPIKRLAEGVCNRFGARFDSDLLRRNLVKALATGASMLYNYCSYILWVFR